MSNPKCENTARGGYSLADKYPKVRQCDKCDAVMYRVKNTPHSTSPNGCNGYVRLLRYPSVEQVQEAEMHKLKRLVHFPHF